MMKNTQAALIWITDILKRHDVPFQIAGGFAACVYGGTRPLLDIDIDVPEEMFHLIQPAVADYITFGPAQFKSDKWDLLLMTLNYQDQEIDLGGAYKTKIFNSQRNEWQTLRVDFSEAVMHTVSGLELPIISRKELISYKKILARDVDLIDVAEIEK
jgi:hypothetical protein